MVVDFVSNEEIVQEARRRLAQGPWNYLVGGSESETTMRRNRLAFDRIAFRPRVLVDVSKIETSTSLLGHHMRIPVLLAPVASLQEFTPEGATASATAAGEFGIIQVVSSATDPSLEETSEAIDSPKIFQLYVHGDWNWTKKMIDRAKNAGYKGLCITVDIASYSRRERQLLTRWTPITRRNPPNPIWESSVTWESIDRMKDYSGLPFILKGISTATDAALAVQHGIDVVWVSNHGGRQLDCGQGTMEMLPEIVDATGGHAEIVLDGGVQHGSDIVKAVAMGAKTVAIGKLQGWGLAANGTQGLVRVLEILQEEIRVAMGLMGVTSIDQLAQSYVCKAEAVTKPHEMSAWVNMPEGRIT